MDVPNHHSPQVPGVFPKSLQILQIPVLKRRKVEDSKNSIPLGNTLPLPQETQSLWQESIGYIAPQIHPPKKNIIDNSKLVQKHTQAIILKNI